MRTCWCHRSGSGVASRWLAKSTTYFTLDSLFHYFCLAHAQALLYKGTNKSKCQFPSPLCTQKQREKYRPPKKERRTNGFLFQVQTLGTSFFLRGRSVLGKAARLIITKMKLKWPYFCLSDPKSISSPLLHSTLPPPTPCFSEKWQLRI